MRYVVVIYFILFRIFRHFYQFVLSINVSVDIQNDKKNNGVMRKEPCEHWTFSFHRESHREEKLFTKQLNISLYESSSQVNNRTPKASFIKTGSVFMKPM